MIWLFQKISIDFQKLLRTFWRIPKFWNFTVCLGLTKEDQSSGPFSIKICILFPRMLCKHSHRNSSAVQEWILVTETGQNHRFNCNCITAVILLVNTSILAFNLEASPDQDSLGITFLAIITISLIMFYFPHSFYLSEIVLALEHLHKQGIIYRWILYL